jgi:hypothetical protein
MKFGRNSTTEKSDAIVPQSRWEYSPWAAEATSILPAGPAACQRLASPVGSRQATGPRRRARPGRVAGDGQPARLGLGTYDKSSCNAGGAAAGSCWALAGSEKRVQKLVGLDHSIGHPSWPASPGKKAAVTESHSS